MQQASEQGVASAILPAGAQKEPPVRPKDLPGSLGSRAPLEQVLTARLAIPGSCKQRRRTQRNSLRGWQPKDYLAH